MKFDFLQQFPARMKTVGIYSLLVKNSAQKTTWKQFDIQTFDEQLNVIYAVLLYIMEQSLRDEPCTIEDVTSFLDELNLKYLKKEITYLQCRELSDFIINVVLCDEGRVMYFQGFNFEAGNYEQLHVSYVANKIVYLTDDVRRTSYYLTEDGYNLLLSTLEMESNMKLTIHEMIFKLHLEKATYDKAANDIRTIFNMLRMQYQKIQDAMHRIQHNALQYAVADYEALQKENLTAVEDTRKRFAEYRKKVTELVENLTEKDIHVKKLDGEDLENLQHLKIIEDYLNRALEEHQKILTLHFDMKELYTKELESLSQMAMIKRFDLKSELDDPLLRDVRILERIDFFLRPLLNQNPDKVYNLNLALQKQAPLYRKKQEETELISLDVAEWQQQQQEEKLHRLRQYQNSLELLLTAAVAEGGCISFSELVQRLDAQLATLIPSVEIFQEIVIELLRSQNIHLKALYQERQAVLKEQLLEFQLHDMLLDLFDLHPDWNEFDSIVVQKLEGAKDVLISHVMSDTGQWKQIRCSDFVIKLLQQGELV